MKYEDYKEEVIREIHNCIEDMSCQPILFIGSGLSRRYINAPNWEGLLEKMAEMCPDIQNPYAYYKQTIKDPIAIGSKLAELYSNWAWNNQDNFPKELFDASYTSDVYFKHKICDLLSNITPKDIRNLDERWNEEIVALKEIRPHAVITTNYDQLLEVIFPEYESIIGQKILKSEYTSIGEIFKIHGCISQIKSIVITESDYDEFVKKKKYLSAKLLTFFAEHPLLFIGYSAEDPNVRAILSDIDEIISTSPNELVPNIYFLDWNEKAESETSFARERPMILEGQRTIRVKNIVANSFKWVFEAFSVDDALDKVNPKLLRALLARTYDLVRTDVPRRTVELDYLSLQNALSQDNGVAKIFGITTTNNPKAFNINYPYTLGEIGKRLGFNGWHGANDLILKIKEDKGIDIKLSDNQYHVAVKTSQKTTSRKYSDSLTDLLFKVKNGEEYVVKLDNG